MPVMDDKTALILLAHGSRDTRWKEPFVKIKNEIQKEHFFTRNSTLKSPNIINKSTLKDRVFLVTIFDRTLKPPPGRFLSQKYLPESISGCFASIWNRFCKDFWSDVGGG